MHRLATPTSSPPRAAGTYPGRSSVVSAVVIAWLGLLVHNVADLPDQTLLSPETLGPSLVTGTLVVVYATGAARAAGIGLLIWALLNIAGGALSVLPLPALAFTPEQTLRHYSFHLLYATTQIPLLVVAYRLAMGRDPRLLPVQAAARPPFSPSRPTQRQQVAHPPATPHPTRPATQPQVLQDNAPAGTALWQ